MDAVVVRAPASTSNLGSGFDTLGLAVNLHNQVTLRRQGVRVIFAPAQQLVAEAARLFFRRAKAKPFGIEIAIQSDIPIARGLGASGALRAAIVAGLNELSGARLPKQSLLEIITNLEGHPDNASPALLGGCTVSGRIGKEVRCLSFDVDEKLKVVTLIPPFKVETEEARRLVPQNFSKADTAHSLNRAALIAAAFASRNYRALKGLFDDRLHQPYREKLVPRLFNVIKAGEKAGAIGGFLSGSGSAIICLTLEKADAVARAMNRQMPEAEVKILKPENEGLKIIRRA